MGLDGPVIKLHVWENRYGQSRPCSLRSQSFLRSSSDHLGKEAAFPFWDLVGLSSVSCNYVRRAAGEGVLAVNRFRWGRRPFRFLASGVLGGEINDYIKLGRYGTVHQVVLSSWR